MGNFIDKLNKLAKVQQRLPHLMAIEGVNFSKERFVRKNWVDNKREPWKKRKREDRGSLMVRTGRLKRSIRKISVGSNYAIIGTDVPYAQIHNEGGQVKATQRVRNHKRRTSRGEVTVSAHVRKVNFTIDARRFMGDSAVLGRRIERLVERQINNAIQ